MKEVQAMQNPAHGKIILQRIHKSREYLHQAINDELLKGWI
jgi:hypothetical protein